MEVELKTSKDIEYIKCLLNIVTCVPSSNFQKCNYCCKYVVNLVMHVLVDCEDNNLKRSTFWDCIALYFPIDIMLELQSKSIDELFDCTLGKSFSPILDEDVELNQNFILLVAAYAHMSLEIK